MKILKLLTTFVILFIGVTSIMMLGKSDLENNLLGWLWIIPSQLVIAPAYNYFKGII
jgi:hypothetical protein